MPRGLTVAVHRGEKSDEFGDTNRTLVGEIPGCILVQENYESVNGRREAVATTNPLLFAPRSAPVKLKNRDRVTIQLDDDTKATYSVISPKQWDHAHALTGRDFRRYCVEVTAVL